MLVSAGGRIWWIPAAVILGNHGYNRTVVMGPVTDEDGYFTLVLDQCCCGWGGEIPLHGLPGDQLGL